MVCKPAPAFFGFRFNGPIYVAIFRGPINHSSKACWHLCFKGNCLWVYIRGLDEITLRTLAVGCERPKRNPPRFVDAINCMFNVMLSAKIPIGIEQYPLVTVKL